MRHAESTLQIWEINNVVYSPPTLPTLLNMINGGTYASNYTKAEHTFILMPDEGPSFSLLLV